MSLAPESRRELLTLARASIEAALPGGEFIRCTRDTCAADLLQHGSSFITLRRQGALRGCCGSIDAVRPLAEDVWRNAWASAISDHRFPRLSAAEWPDIELHISRF